MSVDVMRQELLERIQNGDEQYIRVLNAVSRALDEAAQNEEEITDKVISAIPPSPDWKQMTQAELVAELEESIAQVEKGDFVTLEELEKDMEQW